MVNEPTSRMVYVVIAQALDERVPPFILLMYGTNNVFTGTDVVRRWHFMRTELERYFVLRFVSVIEIS